MRTSELIEQALEVDRVVSHENRDNCVVVFIGRCGMILAKVFVNETHAFDTSWKGFYELKKQSKDRLLTLIYEYTVTPLEEREEPKRYKLKHKLIRDDGYLNYVVSLIRNDGYLTYVVSKKELIFSSEEETRRTKSTATIKEWEALTEQTWEDLLLQFKAIEV